MKELFEKKQDWTETEVWAYIRAHLIDPREGSEWFWCLDGQDAPARKPIVEPWKCPYHNGRMCLELMARCKRDV